MRTLLLLIASLAALPAQAQLYKWTDAEGKVHVTDRPPENTAPQKVIDAPKSQQPVQSARVKESWQIQDQEYRARKAREAQAERKRQSAALQSNGGSRRIATPSPQALGQPQSSTDPSSQYEREACDHERRELEFFEKTKNLQVSRGGTGAVRIGAAEREQLIRDTRTNYNYACGGRR
jgi:hypothetical protein